MVFFTLAVQALALFILNCPVLTDLGISIVILFLMVIKLVFSVFGYGSIDF